MRQLGQRLPLEQDPIACGRALGTHELDRDAPAELGIPRAPHDAHATGADLLEQLIAADLDRLGGREQRGRDPCLRDRELDRVFRRRCSQPDVGLGVIRHARRL
jgi:hypothetical protein